MPDAPAATPVLSITSTSSPALARCHAVERPWTPAPTTRCLTEGGRVGGTGSLLLAAISVAYDAMALPLCRCEPTTARVTRQPLPPMGGPTTTDFGYGPRGWGSNRRSKPPGVHTSR